MRLKLDFTMARPRHVSPTILPFHSGRIRRLAESFPQDIEPSLSGTDRNASNPLDDERLRNAGSSKARPGHDPAYTADRRRGFRRAVEAFAASSSYRGRL